MIIITIKDLSLLVDTEATVAVTCKWKASKCFHLELFFICWILLKNRLQETCSWPPRVVIGYLISSASANFQSNMHLKWSLRWTSIFVDIDLRADGDFFLSHYDSSVLTKRWLSVTDNVAMALSESCCKLATIAAKIWILRLYKTS